MAVMARVLRIPSGYVFRTETMCRTSRRSTNPFHPGVVILRGPVQTNRGAERLH
jgi:hypothetical protein